jgi:tRNA modification GTPase
VLRLYNKSDALDAAALRREREDRRARPEHARDALWISARSGLGLDALRARLRELAGADAAAAGGSFSARARATWRHSIAPRSLLAGAQGQLREGMAELAAEELRRAQAALGEITAPLDADALLGRIFAGFCIGK